jgi:outer membrane receptor protein involved in Fe transport
MYLSQTLAPARLAGDSRAVLVALTLLASTLHAQINSGSAAPAQIDSEERIVLSPFVVSAEQDVGFVAASSLAGGRIATALKDTPVAYSVLTAEFLEAFNLNDVVEAASWTVNSSSDVNDNTSSAFGTTSANNLKLRGTSVGSPTRNFFPYIVTPDNYNLDRVDFARGPNAVLFGAGGIGGTLNSVTKQALPGRELTSVRFQVGSFERYRVQADINRAFLNKKAAIRINLMRDQSDTWRDHEWSERYGVSLAATFKLTPRLTLRVEGETGRREEARSTTALRDQLSAWDGTTTFSGVVTPALNQATRAAAGVNGPTRMRWVQQASFPGDTLLNFGNLYTTAAASQNATLANTSRINGVPIRTVGFNLGNTAMVDDYEGIPGDRWANALRGSSFFFVPSREVTPLWSNKVPTYEEEGQDLAAYLNYKLGDHLFIELAADVNEGNKIGNTAVRRGLMDLYLDINRVLPNGAANPNFLHPYTEFMEYRNVRNDRQENLRAQVVYSRDFRYGKMSFSAMAGSNKEKGEARARTLLLPLTSARLGAGTAAVNYTGLDARSWVDNEEYSEFGVYTRLYLDQQNRYYPEGTEKPYTILNPVTNQTETVTPRWMYDTRREDNNRNSLRTYEFFQTAANLDLFQNRLILIGAFRRDFATIADKRVISPGDSPVGWDGTSLEFRRDAPADYFDLMYYPRDAAGNITGPAQPALVRPRTRVNSVNTRQPQYAGDRFRDDYDSPALSPNVNTFTAGGVFNVTRWLGVYGNVSQTFSLTTPQQRVDGTLSPPTASQGMDYGVRFNLPGGRLAVSIGGYDSYQEKTPVNMDFNFKNDYNLISSAPPIGDLSPGARNIRNVPAFPDNVYSSITREVKGYELDATANLTPNWRLIVNVGYVDAQQKDQFPDIIEYFKTQDPIARQILADAGVVIDSANNASIRPELNDPTLINLGRVQGAVTGWNHLQDILIPNITNTAPQPIIGNSEWVGNLATDFRISRGLLKGLRIGGGINYRGEMVLGYRGSDTIVDPADPTRAIDDPSVDNTTPVLAPAYSKVVASLSYTFKLRQKRTVQVDLNIDNLLDYDKPIRSTGFGGQSATYVRARDGNISSPARVTVPGLFSYMTPRSVTLSTKLSF